MKKIIILLAITLVGCKVKKTNEVTKTEIKTEFKTEYIDTGSTKIERITEYVHFYDTITKKLYIYPKIEKETISENKAIVAKKDSSVVVNTKEIKKSVTKPNSSLLWKLIGIGIIILVIIWYWIKIKKFIGI